MSLPSIQRVFLESVAAEDKDGRFVVVKDIQMYYKVAIPKQHQIFQNQSPLPNEPHKPVILCLHHMLGNQYTWKYLAQPLADITGCHVISYDRPAFGFTERPTQWEENNNPYTQEASVEHVTQLVERLGYGDRKIIFVGTSSGAAISCAFAIKYPHKVHSLILMGASIRPEDQVGSDDRYLNIDKHIEVFEYIKLNAPENAMIELVTIEKCGHLPQEEKPQEVLNALVNFVQRVGV
ncbi:7086_t:CDS:2 [Acaulospora colombiana]|uniref:7086_t:CDS:1 n=1 Tax=Acaulospora colombiana TaxID=27376 RepID=A0ACA9LNH5_9GLOM|nr:7086_t:CDS:2 [Acaulospora colombiana]